MPQAKSGALVGRVLGGFVVREPLSSGGFGAVYRAEQVALAREAVIKVLHARLLDNETMVQRFLREARLASRLDHPYAAHIYAFGAETDGLLWIAMELVRGTPLDRLLRAQGPISLERFVPLLERICEVVHSAHEQGIVHRDLKPANVMVLERSGRLLPKLLDFGIAKLSAAAEGHGLSDTTPMDSVDIPLPAATPPHGFSKTEVLDEVGAEAAIAVAAAADVPDDATVPHDVVRPPTEPTRTTSSSFPTAGITQVGTTVGSPLYMAPEQWTDSALTTARTDIYALGILCHEALTGQPPFNAGNHMELALAHATAPVPPLGPDFPPALDTVISRALEKFPDDRYATALELAGAFRAASGVVAEPIGLPRLEVSLRSAAMTRLPRPLALAVDAFDGARNAHQARDACWQLVRTAIRLVSVAALASHAHVQDPVESHQAAVEDALRRLRDRHPSDATWLAMARELTRPFAAMREAYPVPPLVDLLVAPTSALDDLLALRDRSDEWGGAHQDQVLELLEIAVPMVARLLDELSFLQEHAIAVPTERGVAEEWAGARRDRRRRRLPGGPLAAGRPVLVDAVGNVEVLLWPFVQIHTPAPGAAPALFLFDGKGRRGARLVALPDPFEHEDDTLWEAFGAFFRQTPDSFGTSTPIESCPFPGLAAFTGAEAASFFGREREAEAFLNRLRVQPLLTVVGPSGAGKSSFVHAGVLPALPEGWRTVALRPGPAPLVSLGARLEALGVAAGEEAAPAELAEALRAWADAKDTCLVLFVDQLEELFTLCADAAERNRFAELLALVARSPEDPVRVVLTVRDDFLLRLESLPALRERLGPGLQLLTTPLEPDLRRILIEPLRRAGYEFDDPALPDRIIAEVAGTPGALALLSFTASKLWELRDRRFHQITARAYESLAGVGGALAQHAEVTLQAMHAEQQRLVREVFRNAVTAEGTRAILTRAELTEVLGSSSHAGHVIEKLLAARLLVVSDDERGGERIEVTHEALLDAWPRLVGWRREDAEGARLRDQLRAASRQWAERGRPSGLLWRGDALAEYRLWRARVPGSLTGNEEAFAAASLADAARGRRLRRAAFGAAFLALAAFAVVLLVQNARVQHGARQTHSLLLTQYGDQGRRLLLGDDPVLALAYLHKASKLGAHGPAHDFLVAEAVRATDGELFALRHDGMVGRVRFSPDGTTLATASLDGTARLWDTRSGALVARLDHKATNVRVEWSPRGDLIASGSEDGVVRLWDARGKPLRQIQLGAGIQSLVFTPDARQLVSHTVQDEITLSDTATGERIALLHAAVPGPPSTARSALALAPDGVRLAAGDRAGKLHIWRLPGPQPVASWQAHAATVYRIAFSPDGSRLVSSADTENEAIVWNVETGQRVFGLAHEGGVRVAAFSPDGSRILTGSDDRTAAVWSAESGKRLQLMSGHVGGVWHAAWSDDGSLIGLASDDGTATLWDAASGRRVARRVGHRGGLRDIAFDARGTRMATASLDGRAILWTTVPSQQVTALVGHKGDVLSAGFSPSGAHVLTGSQDGTARIWDAATGRPLLVMTHCEGVIARFSPEGRRVATGCDDGTVRIWDARTGARLVETAGGREPVTEVAWAPDGGLLATVGLDGAVRVWAAETGELRRTIGGPAGARMQWVAFHPSRPLLVTTSDDGVTRLWEPATGRETARVPDVDQRQLGDIDRSGSRVVSATPRRTAQIWNLETGAVERDLLGHVGNVISARWSPDGSFIATAAMDGTARIWDAEHGRELAVYAHGDAWIVDAGFSPDMSRLVISGSGGLAEIWDLPVLEISEARLEQIVRCRAPYDTEGDEIVPRRGEPIDCVAR